MIKITWEKKENDDNCEWKIFLYILSAIICCCLGGFLLCISEISSYKIVKIILGITCIILAFICWCKVDKIVK